MNRGNDLVRGSAGDDYLVGDSYLLVVPEVVKPSEARDRNNWPYQGGDWFDEYLSIRGKKWFDHPWYQGGVSWLDNSWFDHGHGNDGDWAQHHREWLEFAVTEFFGRTRVGHSGE